MPTKIPTTRSNRTSPARTLFKVDGKVYTITELSVPMESTTDEIYAAFRAITYKKSGVQLTRGGLSHAIQTRRLRDTGGGTGR